MARNSLALAIVAFFSHLFLPYIWVVSLLGLAAILGIVAILIILRSKRTIPGLRLAILGVAISLSIMSYDIKSHHDNALDIAIEKGDVQKIRKLISKGYDVNAASGGGQNMLTLTFWYGLRKVSPFSDTQQISLMTQEEVESKILEMLEMLIDSGADINVLDPHGWTPIHSAAQRKQLRIVKMLIDKGVDVRLRNRFGESPLHFAAGHPNNSQMIEALVAKGADVNGKNARGNTPLHGSVYSGSVETVETLLKNGADVHLENGDGKTPLQVAIEEGRTAIANFLRQYGAKE